MVMIMTIINFTTIAIISIIRGEGTRDLIAPQRERESGLFNPRSVMNTSVNVHALVRQLATLSIMWRQCKLTVLHSYF